MYAKRLASFGIISLGIVKFIKNSFLKKIRNVFSVLSFKLLKLKLFCNSAILAFFSDFVFLEVKHVVVNVLFCFGGLKLEDIVTCI